MRVLLALACLLLSACSGSRFAYRSPGPYDGGPLLGTGSYFVEAYLGPNGEEPRRFNGVFARRPDATIFNAVAPSGRPLFRVRDPMMAAAAPEEKMTNTELELPKGELEEFYETLRPLILLDDAGKSSPWVKERYDDGRPRLISMKEGLRLRIDEYDWEGHAFRLRLEGPGWTGTAALREYDIAR